MLLVLNEVEGELFGFKIKITFYEASTCCLISRGNACDVSCKNFDASRISNKSKSPLLEKWEIILPDCWASSIFPLPIKTIRTSSSLSYLYLVFAISAFPVNVKSYDNYNTFFFFINYSQVLFFVKCRS